MGQRCRRDAALEPRRWSLCTRRQDSSLETEGWPLEQLTERTDAGDVLAALRGEIFCQWCERYDKAKMAAFCDECRIALAFGHTSKAATARRGHTGHIG